MELLQSLAQPAVGVGTVFGFLIGCITGLLVPRKARP